MLPVALDERDVGEELPPSLDTLLEEPPPPLSSRIDSNCTPLRWQYESRVLSMRRASSKTQPLSAHSSSERSALESQTQSTISLLFTLQLSPQAPILLLMQPRQSGKVQSLGSPKAPPSDCARVGTMVRMTKEAMIVAKMVWRCILSRPGSSTSGDDSKAIIS